MVSHIHLELGAGIGQPHPITWHDSNIKRSKVKNTKSRNVSSITSLAYNMDLIPGD